jgi:hypothetical protein
MNESAGGCEQIGSQAGADDIFSADVPDAALEAAGGMATPGGAMSFPNAPTVSILIMCCSFDGSS